MPTLGNPNPLVLMDPILAPEIITVQKNKPTEIIKQIYQSPECSKLLLQLLLSVRYCQQVMNVKVAETKTK